VDAGNFLLLSTEERRVKGVALRFWQGLVDGDLLTVSRASGVPFYLVGSKFETRAVLEKFFAALQATRYREEFKGWKLVGLMKAKDYARTPGGRGYPEKRADGRIYVMRVVTALADLGGNFALIVRVRDGKALVVGVP